MNQYEILKHYFGYDTFRDGQEKLIHAILEGRDVLGIMPTGAGKSLCYQIPALMMGGITLVPFLWFRAVDPGQYLWTHSTSIIGDRNI